MWCQISQARLIKGVESMLFRQWASSCLLARFAHLMVISRFIIGAILRYTANCSFIILCIILSYFRCLVHGLVHELRDKPGWAEPLNRPNGHRKEPKFTWPRWLCSATNLADAILCYEKAGTRSFQQTDRALIEQIVQEYLGQHRTIPALRLKHRSGSCGTASALPKCSIRHPVLSALLAWHLPHLARRIGT